MGNRASRTVQRVSQPGLNVKVARSDIGKGRAVQKDGRDPQLVQNASSLGQVDIALTRPHTPFEAQQPGVFQIRRRAQLEASDAAGTNRVHARDLQTLLYTFHSGKGKQDLPAMLEELRLDEKTFAVLCDTVAAIDFVEADTEATNPSVRQLRRVRSLYCSLQQGIDELQKAIWPSEQRRRAKAKTEAESI